MRWDITYVNINSPPGRVPGAQTRIQACLRVRFEPAMRASTDSPSIGFTSKLRITYKLMDSYE